MKTLTYSMINTFLACRKQYEYRYLRNLVPVERSMPLTFGACVHIGLEWWFKWDGMDKDEQAQRLSIALFHMHEYGALNHMPEDELTKACALVERYTEYWAGDEERFEVVEVEYKFSSKLLHPKSHRTSRTWMLEGKVDGIVRMSDGLYILEHKTTSALDAPYLDRIHIDSQIAIYANAISHVMGEPVVGAIYDILVKPRTRFKAGETEEAFEARKAELLAKSKTGKTTAKRQEAETMEAFQDRCMADITEDNFRREIVRFTPEDLTEHLNEVWQVGKALNAGCVYRNTGNCTRFGRPCPYLPLCRARGDVGQCDGLFEECAPHEELRDDN